MDEAHKETDRILAKLEKKIKTEYRTANKEIQAKANDYFRRFEIKDRKKREQLKAGEITPEEYKQWETGQVLIGERWVKMRDELAKAYHNSNKIARSIADGKMPDIYAINHNYATYDVEHQSGIDTGYTLYDSDTVVRLMNEDPDLLPPPGKAATERIKAGKDVLWNKQQIQSTMTQAILQGVAIPELAKKLTRVTEKNYKAAIRNARTMTTGAENAGRQNGYKRAQKMGIELQKKWIATLDNRTRHEHRLLDNQVVDIDDPFNVDGYDIRFPGDPEAEGFLVYNCRCTMVSVIKGHERDRNIDEYSGKLHGMSYEEWKNAKSESQSITAGVQRAKEYKQSYINDYKKILEDAKINDKTRLLDTASERQAEITRTIKNYGEWEPKELDGLGLSEQTINAVRYYVALMPDNEAAAWRKAFSKATFEKGLLNETVYPDKTIRLNNDATANTVFHELSHFIDMDSSVSISKTIQDNVAKMVQSGKTPDFETLCDFIGLKMNKEKTGLSMDSKEYVDNIFVLSKWLTHNDEKYSKFYAVSDIVDGMTKGVLEYQFYDYGWHGKEYWAREIGNLLGSPFEAEAWANFGTLKATQGITELQLLNNIAPNLMEVMEECYKKMTLNTN